MCNVHLSNVYMKYKQFDTYTNICLIFWESWKKKKRPEGCGNSSKVTQHVRAEINILVFTKPPGEILLTISQKDCFAKQK